MLSDGRCASCSPAAKSTTSSPRRRCSRASTAAALIADKAYDSNAFREMVAKPGCKRSSPPTDRAKSSSRTTVIYKSRNRIERCFNKLKHFRRFATRFDRLDAYFLAFIHLAAAMIWMR